MIDCERFVNSCITLGGEKITVGLAGHCVSGYLVGDTLFDIATAVFRVLKLLILLFDSFNMLKLYEK